MWRQLLLGISLCLLSGMTFAQTTGDVAGPLSRALRAAGIPIVSVSIGDVTNKATWRVQPPELQPQAQPIIDAFDPSAPAILAAELDTEARQMPRHVRAWMLFYLRDKLGRNPTQTERQAARDALIQAYKD